MKILRTVTKLAGWGVLTAWAILLPALALAAPPPNPGVPNPTLTVKRAGRLLTLDCQLLDANGQKSRNPDRNRPPTFAVYQGDQLVGSGTFEYG
jgi:hypothetical protein